MVTTDTASFRAPEEVIRRIGLGKLKDLADEARCGCVRKHIKEPFLTWLKKTNKTHKDLANLLGVSRAKATRLCNGYLKGMKLEDVDNYLSIVGFSIDDALPSKRKVHLEILQATVRAMRKQRRQEGEPIDDGKIKEDELLRIDKLVQRIDHAEPGCLTDPDHWRSWLDDQLQLLALGRSPAVAKSWSNGSLDRIPFALLIGAADWLAAREYLPWKATILVAVYQEVSVADHDFVQKLLRAASNLESAARSHPDLRSHKKNLDDFVMLVLLLRKLLKAFEESPSGQIAGPQGIAKYMGYSPQAVYVLLEMVGLDVCDFRRPPVALGHLLRKSRTINPLIEEMLELALQHGLNVDADNEGPNQ